MPRITEAQLHEEHGEKARQHNRGIIRRLIRDFHGDILPYRLLRREAQFAMAYYMAINGEAWKVPEGFNDRWAWAWRRANTGDEVQAVKKSLRIFRATLPHWVALYGERKFGYVVIPMSVLKDAIMECHADASVDFDTFDAYHEWYVGRKWHVGHGHRHTRRNPWPVILDSTGTELFEDGWHRFHRYVELGLLMVPCLYYPK